MHSLSAVRPPTSSEFARDFDPSNSRVPHDLIISSPPPLQVFDLSKLEADDYAPSGGSPPHISRGGAFSDAPPSSGGGGPQAAALAAALAAHGGAAKGGGSSGGSDAGAGAGGSDAGASA